MATSGPPLGITQLMALDSVMIIKKSKLFESNKYELVAPDNSVIMFAEEKISALRNFFSDNSRTVNISIRDTQNEEVIRLRRPSPSFVLSKMKVLMCGRLASVVRQKMTWRQPVLYVNDAVDRPVLKIKGPKMSCLQERDYQVFSAKTDIGEISKKVHRDGNKSHACACLSFPRDLDVRYKGALIGASILIDYLD